MPDLPTLRLAYDSAAGNASGPGRYSLRCMATEDSASDGAKAPSEDTAGGQAPASEDATAQGTADEQTSGSGETSAGPEATADEQTSAGGEPTGEPGATADGKTAREFADAGAEALIEAAFTTGDFGPARELLETARDAAAAGGDRQTEAVAIERLATLAHYENITKLTTGGEVPAADTEAEEKLFRQALPISQELDDKAGTARSAFGVGLVFQVLRRDWPTAMSYYWQALDLSPALEASSDLHARSEIHRHLGFYYHYEDASPGEAVRHLQLSLDLREQTGDPRLLPSALVALGEAELAAGNSERAVELLTRAVAGARDAGLLSHRVEDAERALREAQAAAAAGDAGQAGNLATEEPDAGSGAATDSSDGEG
jgi:tetratricopeptide (TPR) repeat protein